MEAAEAALLHFANVCRPLPGRCQVGSSGSGLALPPRVGSARSDLLRLPHASDLAEVVHTEALDALRVCLLESFANYARRICRSEFGKLQSR